MGKVDTPQPLSPLDRLMEAGRAVLEAVLSPERACDELGLNDDAEFADARAAHLADQILRETHLHS